MVLPAHLPTWVIDFAIGFTVLEGLVLQLRARRRRRAGLEAPPVWADLLAGISLMLAARTALQEGSAVQMAACLLAALGAHLFDLRGRWRPLGKRGR